MFALTERHLRFGSTCLIACVFAAIATLARIATADTGGMVYNGRIILSLPARSLYGAAFRFIHRLRLLRHGCECVCQSRASHKSESKLPAVRGSDRQSRHAGAAEHDEPQFRLCRTRSADLLESQRLFGASNSIVKFSPGDATHGPSYVASIPLNSGEVCAASMIDISGSNHFGYFTITGSTPRMVKVDLDTFQIVGSANFSAGQNAPRRSVIDTGRGYAYAVSRAPNSSYLAKFNLDLARGPFAEVSSVDLSPDIDSTVGGGFGDAVIDLAHDYAYVGTYQVKSAARTPSSAQARVVKIDLNGESNAAAHSRPVAYAGVRASRAVDCGVRSRRAGWWCDLLRRRSHLPGADLSGHCRRRFIADVRGRRAEPSRRSTQREFCRWDESGCQSRRRRPGFYAKLAHRSPQSVHHYAYFGTDTNAGQVAKIEIPVPFLAGDYNDNGFVDAADYVMWRKNVGQPPGTLPNDSTGVPIGDDQYNLWRSNFGNPTANGNVITSSSIPEPDSCLTVSVVSAIMLMNTCKSFSPGRAFN